VTKVKYFFTADSMGMGGSGFGAFGGGITSSGLEMFGQKKPPASAMLNPAAQQAFQQASVKPNKPSKILLRNFITSYISFITSYLKFHYEFS